MVRTPSRTARPLSRLFVRIRRETTNCKLFQGSKGFRAAVKALREQQAQQYKAKAGMGDAPHMKKKGLPSNMKKDHQTLEEMQLDSKKDATDI
jgi:hypothetical protein